jgi:adenine-specific DNA-methyltransferase
VLDAKKLDEAKAAAAELKRLSKPFLNWAGKAERLSFDVPTLPLFIHERLSTRAILETLTRHKKDQQTDFLDLFGDPQHSITDQVLRAYEHRDKWVNRMILGDSLVVMNSLLHYEGLGGQVQMIYIDPPYGVKFGSNFQPFVRKRDVKHNDDEDFTREPEMVQAYRDTWELGLHSYLTYLRDRLLLARELLTPSGSVFVQISDENAHHVRELLSEVFGEENALPTVVFRKTTGAGSPSGYVEALPQTYDNLVWFARDRTQLRVNRLFVRKDYTADPNYRWIEAESGERRALRAGERPEDFLQRHRLFSPNPLTSQTGGPTTQFAIEFNEKLFKPGKGGWKTNSAGIERLRETGRLIAIGDTLRFVRYIDDFTHAPVIDIWDDTRQSGFGEQKLYVVQTAPRVIERCLLLTTQPGDLVLDPTCGSGTTAYVAEQWGRRWITIDTSRVPLALARQRLLTATYDWYELNDEKRGPASGFVYKRKQNAKGEEVGGIVPHITLKSIANDEPPAEEVLVDRPEKKNDIVRVTGPFTLEATIPTPVDWERDGIEDSSAAVAESYGSFVERMLEVLRRSPLLHLEGNRTITLKNVRPPAKTLVLSAEALVNGNGASGQPVAFVFGPENGAVSEKLVYEAAREAHLKNYSHLYVVGFAVEPNARELVEKAQQVVGVAATYVQATPDLLMGDLLKNMRSSQIFSVCGLPEVRVEKVPKKDKSDPVRYQVSLLGLDTFDPVTMDVEHRQGDDVPCWLLDTDYNELCFRVGQAFFPRTGAWENLKKALKADFEESVWQHLAGTVSAPFEAGQKRKIAVKVIDDRGNELLVVKDLPDA